MRLQRMDFNHLSMWVQIYNLPLESFNVRIGMELAKRIGTSIEADGKPCFNELGTFQRVKIKLHARDSLPLGIEFHEIDENLGLLPINIENLGLFCFKCGRIGHDKGKCMFRFSLMPGFVNNLKPKRFITSLRGAVPKNKETQFPIVVEKLGDEKRMLIRECMFM